MRKHKVLETVEKIVKHAKENGVAHLTTEDQELSNNSIKINENDYVNFGSCSYLGLEFNKELREGAKKAIDDYGTQFSSSRAYVSPRYYSELESKLSEIFEAEAIVTPTTTLGHIAAIPVLVGPDDIVILDHQVHNSVQTAVSLVKAKGIKVEMVRHNRMDLLEEKINQYKGEYDNIWYMADGIYSMYGDAAPLDEIYELMDKYPQFRFYVDDAHGMSCYGKNGRGYVLAERNIHSQMILATSFAKAFATGGGALVFPTKELANSVRSLGGPMITSGPMQPSALGAAIASADFHLSGRIKEYQEDLQENIKYTHLMLKKYKLPNLAADFSPIFFVGVGLPKIAYSLVNKLMKDGFFLNIGIFPAVPIKNTGVRFTITRLHTFKQIEEMIKSMAKHFPVVLEEEDYSIENICKAFKVPNVYLTDDKQENSIKKESGLIVEHVNTILDISKDSWNELLGDRGTFDWTGLNILENSFTDNKLPEENWDFDYITIKDNKGKVILSTFLTTSITKDDMLMPAEISMEVEEKRLEDSYFFTSKTLQIGSQLTEGNHLYLDRTSPYWEEAMTKFLHEISKIQEENKIDSVMLRDLDNFDKEMDDFMVNNGFFKTEMLTNNIVRNATWTNEDELLATLSSKSRYHIRKDVLRNEHLFDVDIVTSCSEEDLRKYYKLYLNVKNKSMELNTYKLPLKVFRNFVDNKDWDLIVLSSKSNENSQAKSAPLSIGFCHKGINIYTFLMMGMDYDSGQISGVYRQTIYQSFKRARSLGYKNINMGYSSNFEKRKFGATQIQSCAYMQVKDNFSMEALNAISVSRHNKRGYEID